ESAQVQARDMVAELTHPEYGPFRYLGIPIKMSDTPGRMESAPPRFGEHNRAVLVELGYSEGAIDQLYERQVLAAASRRA
ncbi:MAG: CoA transferase, partial [Vicinamibacterales bacterium]